MQHEKQRKKQKVDCNAEKRGMSGYKDVRKTSVCIFESRQYQCPNVDKKALIGENSIDGKQGSARRTNAVTNVIRGPHYNDLIITDCNMTVQKYCNAVNSCHLVTEIWKY